jgi:hypothetical protein
MEGKTKGIHAVFSDSHLGGDGHPASSEMFCAFLDYLKRMEGLEAVTMDGDIVGYTEAGSLGTAVRREERAFALLDELSRRVPTGLVRGNHDIDLPADELHRYCPRIKLHEPEIKRIILRKELRDDTATPKEVHKVLYTGREEDGMLFDHGYVYDHYFFDNPRKWNWMVRWGDKLEWLTEGPAYSNQRSGAARMFSRRLSQKARSEKTLPWYLFGNDGKMPRGPRKQLELAARDAALYEVVKEGGIYTTRKRSTPLHAVFFGHTHQEPTLARIYDEILKHESPTDSWYINTGCWKYGKSGFALIQPDGSIGVYRWNEKLGPELLHQTPK